MKIKNSLRRLKYKFKHNYLTVENVVLIFAIILCFTWTYQSISAMSRNWELSERLTAERKSLELAKLEVEATELQNEYYKSNEYQELMARRNLDKKLPGENMVVMPENSDTAKNKHRDEPTAPVIETPEYTNTEKWMMYLFPKY